MKKTTLLMTAALLCLAFAACEREEVKHEETVQPLFSVAEGHQVLFSPGNLQYLASTGEWRFAQHQWDVVGNAAGNTTAQADGRDSQPYWIDLFCWGTGSNAVNKTCI